MNLENLFFSFSVYLDPIIRILLIFSGVFLVFWLLQMRVPKVNVRDFNPFSKMTPAMESEEIDKQRSAVTSWIIKAYRAKRKSEVPISDFEILQRMLLYAAGIFFATYLVLGTWTGVFNPETFHPLLLLDLWLIGIAFIMSIQPFVILFIRLHRVRIQNSYDLVPAIKALLTKYRYYKGNLYYTLRDLTKNDLQGDIKNAFMVFLPILQGQSETTIQQAVDEFYFRIPSNRAIELAILIQKRFEHGDDIDQALSFMVEDMSEQKKINSRIRTQNRETVQLAIVPVFLIPAIIMYNMTLNGYSKTFHYYFVHPTGIRYLVLTIVVCAICAMVASIIQKPRNEV